jgi:hypothetical protein
VRAAPSQIAGDRIEVLLRRARIVQLNLFMLQRLIAARNGLDVQSIPVGKNPSAHSIQVRATIYLI